MDNISTTVQQSRKYKLGGMDSFVRRSILSVVALSMMSGLLVGCAPTVSQKKPSIKQDVQKVQFPVIEVPEALELTRTLYGSCRITAYCSCEKCCGKWASMRPKDENGNPIVIGARGTELTSQYSVACNLPFGTILEIDGLEGQFEVEDRTSQWVQDKYDGMIVDIYFDDHQACYDYLSGKPEWMDVYIVEEA